MRTPHQQYRSHERQTSLTDLFQAIGIGALAICVFMQIKMNRLIHARIDFLEKRMANLEARFGVRLTQQR